MSIQVGKPLPRDSNLNPIPVACDIITQDGTAVTPLESPQSLTTTAVKTIVPPAGALVMVGRSAADVRYGDNVTLDGTANEGYMLCSGGVDFRVPCADGGSIYVRNDVTGTNNFYFFFERVHA